MATIKSIDKLYSFFLQQAAAESYVEGALDSGAVSEALKFGANRQKIDGLTNNEGFAGYTRLTEVQRTDFLSKFDVIHQWSDNPNATSPLLGSAGYIDDAAGKQILANTGLSATLIRTKGTNEYTLSIRSTEFRTWANGGDKERDQEGANKNGIVSSGFALAQQSALEQYYAWLKKTGKLPEGAALNVSGYSLGGNLATVFTELHANEVIETVTFNAPGRGSMQGGVNAQKLRDMLDFYNQVLLDPQAADAFITVLEGDEATGGYFEIRRTAITRKGTDFNDRNIYTDRRVEWAQYATTQRFGLSMNKEWGQV